MAAAPRNVSPSWCQGSKLLGVPSLPPAAPRQPFGDLIAAETVRLLQEWGAADSIRGMVFDTTSTNTGILFFIIVESIEF